MNNSCSFLFSAELAYEAATATLNGGISVVSLLIAFFQSFLHLINTFLVFSLNWEDYLINGLLVFFVRVRLGSSNSSLFTRLQEGIFMCTINL